MTVTANVISIPGQATDVCELLQLSLGQDGLFLVVWRNREGMLQQLHSNPICETAARAMAAELNEEPSPTDDFDGIAAAHELRARILNFLESMPRDYSSSLADIANHLACAEPWLKCHTTRPCTPSDGFF